MNFSDLARNAVKRIKGNSPEILMAMSLTGVVTTAYLAAKAAFKASKVLEEVEKENPLPAADSKERIKEQVKLTWKLYIPAGISGAATVSCIIGSSKLNSKRTAAAVTAYSITEKAFSEYREKVVEQIGKRKEQTLRDELAEEKVKRTAPVSKEVVISGKGHVLCCELYTQRYFRSDMESLRKAQNDINAKILRELYVTLDDFYYLIGLSYTSNSNKLGWDSGKQMELRFTAIMVNDEPCLAFEYNYVKPIV